jgi:hypothetical protein
VTVHLHVNRIPIEQVPAPAEATTATSASSDPISAWTHALFQRKEQRLQYFAEHNCFEGKPVCALAL